MLYRILSVILPVTLLAQPLLALELDGLSDEEKGLAIIKEADKRDLGWHDMKASSEMILRNRQGQESHRITHSQALEVEGDGDKTLIVFDSPRDVNGTAFLSYSHALTPDEQWIYLPALKRIKRISSKNKSGPFMGSEFAYEDISSQEVKKYTYKFLGEEKIDGVDTYVVEQHPAYENSGYTRLITWIHKAEFYPIKVEFYDRKNKHLKTLTYHDYKQYLNQYWRPGRMEMKNHITGKTTTLLWKSYDFKTGLTEKDFDKNSLKRAR